MNHLCLLARCSRYFAFCFAEPLPWAPVMYFFFLAFVFTLPSVESLRSPPRPKLMPFIRISSKSLIVDRMFTGGRVIRRVWSFRVFWFSRIFRIIRIFRFSRFSSPSPYRGGLGWGFLPPLQGRAGVGLSPSPLGRAGVGLYPSPWGGLGWGFSLPLGEGRGEVLMVEQSHSGEGHCDAVLVAGVYDIVVSH